jgi:hypothetical protein
MEDLIYILLRLDYIFVAGLSIYIAFNSKNFERELLNNIVKYMLIANAWTCAYWSIFKLFINEPFPTVIEFVISWSLYFILSKYTLYKILK